MKGKNKQAREVVLVTGSDGFIGSAVVKKLAAHFRVVSLDHGPASTASSTGNDRIDMDLASDESVAAAMHKLRTQYGEQIAAVIHLAAYFDLSGEPNPKYEQVTVRGTERLLRGLQSFQLEQFIYVSTLLVHAPGRQGQPITESWPVASEQPYPASKIKAEQRVLELHGNTPVVLLRPAGVYDDLCHSAFLAHQIGRIYERRLISHFYPADLDTGQPFLHLEDLTDAILRLIQHRHSLPAELPLLLGESEVMSFDSLQRELGKLIHGEEWKTLEIPPPVAKAGAWAQNEILEEDPFIKPWMVDISDDHYEIDTSRAAKLLGWSAQHTLRATLPAMIAALKNDPVGWYSANKLNAAKVAAAGVAAKAEQVQPTANPADEMEKLRAHQQHMRQTHFAMLWVHYLNFLLGAWLAASPFFFGLFDSQYFSAAVLRVTQERNLWSPAWRSELLGWNDLSCGLLIMLFSLMSLSPRLAWAQWANTVTGTWLLFAPLILWAPNAAVYANDTLVGALVITFAILVPMMPGMNMRGMMDQSDLPPGWTYNPSTYLQRLPIIALGMVGFLISYYLAAYQLGHIEHAWDSFFSGKGSLNGTETIITSDVSRAWPVADAGLGAVVYLSEVLMGVMGDGRRWRTMPWMVAIFGITVVPLGAVSIYFIIIQPIVIGTWCSLCLLAGIAMLIMIPYSLDEVVASGQFLVQSVRRKEPFWSTFFRGSAQIAGEHDRQPGFDAPLADSIRSALRGGITLPWTLLVSIAIGIWLMFSRLIFGTEPPLADNDHLVGALITTVSTIALAEIARPLRFLNIMFGLWLITASWLLTGGTTLATWVNTGTGLAIILLSLPRGVRSKEHYGGWDRYVV